MTPAEALELIKEYATFGRIYIVPHAKNRMYERGAREEDIYCAIATSSSCQMQQDERWKVTGQDTDDDELTLIVSIEGMAVIISVF